MEHRLGLIQLPGEGSKKKSDGEGCTLCSPPLLLVRKK